MRSRVLRTLAEIGDEALVLVVTDDPSLWPITDDRPLGRLRRPPPPARPASAPSVRNLRRRRPLPPAAGASMVHVELSRAKAS